jgi:CubicO group peptidase (beta-lactamase class C family)
VNRLVLVVALSLVRSLALAEPKDDRDLGAKLDEYMTRLEKLGYSGGLLVARNGLAVIEKGYGLADREQNRPMGPDSVYSLGSITKQFTAAAILRLEMKGRLTVHDSIARLVKDVPPDKTGITLHMLLTHSAGLESDFTRSDYDPVSRDEYVRRILAAPLVFNPGDRFQYSNAGYSLLAAIVEILSGQTYEAFLKDEVLIPAGMRETGYLAPGWAAERIAQGYRGGDRWGTILERITGLGDHYWALRGNGGLHTTLGDMRRWDQALRTDDVLSAAAREEYLRGYVPEGPGAASRYGYGWTISKTSRGTTLAEHNGGNGIFVAEWQRFLEERLAVLVTSTVAEMKATPVIATVDRIVLGEPYTLPPLAISVAASVLRSCEGNYRFRLGGDIEITSSGHELALAPRDQTAYAVLNGGSDSPRMQSLTERTREIAGRAFSGDFAGLKEAFGSAMTVENIRDEEQGLMEDRESRLGRYKGFSVLGTGAGPEETSLTTVKVEFEKGAVYNIYVWGRRGLRGIRPQPEPPALRLIPISPTRFERFSLEPAPPLEVEFQPSSHGLVLRPPGREVQATRYQ